MKVKKGKWLVVLVVLAMLFAIVSVAGAVSGNGDDCVTLYAGQDMPVGTVCVSNDGDNLLVKYSIGDNYWDDGEGWGLYETHVHVGETLADFPLNRPGNPRIGHFDYKATHDGVKSYTEVIPLDNWEANQLLIASHAVIEKTECELIKEAPYSAYKVVEYDQGVRKDKTSVREGRSDSEAVLTYDLGQDETNFFSLGFKFDDDGNALPEGGWIIVEFDCPIKNGEGNDIMVVEDTWSTYPLETADVYASQNGIDWVGLGEANNLNRDAVYGYHTVAYFDLDDVSMDWAKYIKVVDTTPIDAMPFNGDGYDLNTIVALHECRDCTTYDETAWGDGTRFVKRGNWATYFSYTVKE